jgi:thiosulfate/3-mercaptopyruvate sulfurtransferase
MARIVPMFTTLITPADLVTLLERAEPCVVVDCRFKLAAPEAGRAAYRAGHLPRAVYADLDRDLSGPPVTDRGRHPLPAPETLVALFGRLGIVPGIQVVGYDDMGGMMAARLWWMLRYVGHTAVAVLDGGITRWVAEGRPIETSERTPVATVFTGSADRARLVTLDEVPGLAALVDAREAPRYRGEVEPIDPRPGHIPGARNHPWPTNLRADGCFKSPAELHEAFQASLGTLPDGATVHYCGSGVSACHNVLAQVHAGLAEPRLYCGSWSEWCSDPARPAAHGDEGRQPGGA